MLIRGFAYGPDGLNVASVHTPSGALNLDGKGYKFHKGLWWLGLDTSGTTTIMKTTTVDPRLGNMPLKPGTCEPVEIYPRCIIVRPGFVLNKVNLSGPGLKRVCDWWRVFPDPFGASWMAVRKERQSWMDETREMVDILGEEMPSFLSPFFIEMNVSCPNTGLEHGALDDIYWKLDQIAKLNRAIFVKVSAAETSPRDTYLISRHPNCYGISDSNTFKFGSLPDKINWKKLTGYDRSPLVDVGDPDTGGGGASSPAFVPIVCDHIKAVRDLGCDKPLIAGMGIRTIAHAKAYLDAGGVANTDISLGSIILSTSFRKIQKIVHFVRAYKQEKASTSC